ncbi:S-adenosyl-L-methionine-dependent methyltransferase [Chaetomium fimeti]|uniref:S-adenosyl-L-methionine-dependent methyltransferase n=1 Tax=Chaetomium fimeti TaxID=1854472 RepID=A0AAE0LRH3_9PEZI|nr:S-adenosyl-L-methionine-dependent methyltransferase [Chaetomium fimeti]
MTTANTARFNEEALSWDSNPSVQLATTLAHKAYLAHLPPPAILSTYDILDLGCGTGLLSLALAPSVRSVTAVDAAEGMIVALRSKLEHPPTPKTPPTNIHPIHALLTSPSDPLLALDPVTHTTRPNRRFDLVVSHLVLHHIPDLAAFFTTIHGCLRAGGGRVMVTDFEDFGPAARKFHPESKMDGVERHGIDRGMIRAVMEGVGFAGVRVERAFEMEKAVETEPGSGVLGPVVVFPFLICEGTKV